MKNTCIILVSVFVPSFSSATWAAKATALFHDGAYDDIFSLLINLLHPVSDIKLIVLEPSGEASCEEGLFSTLGILKKVNQLNIPVFCGPEKSFSEMSHTRRVTFPEKWRKETNDLNAFIWGFDIPKTNDSIGYRELKDINELNDKIKHKINLDAKLKNKFNIALKQFNNNESINEIAKLINSETEGINILETGPAVSLAHLASKHPEVFNNFKGVTLMAGSFKQKNEQPGLWGKTGNIQTIFTAPEILNEDAEWNVYIAPKDFDMLFTMLKTKNIPLTIIPLNATKYTPVTEHYQESLKLATQYMRKNESTEQYIWASSLVVKMLERYEFQIKNKFLDFWDCLAAAIFINNLENNKSNPIYAKTVTANIAVNINKEDHPYEFYEKYKKMNLNAFYKLKQNDFIETLNEHQSWAKKETNEVDAYDSYGVTYMWENEDDIPDHKITSSPRATIYLAVSSEHFAKMFLSVLTNV
ncbi:MAG: hypothetical protein HON32_10115 [Francisellaceae bacterium]|nr:hypothetical protein [Francisellaceae bacterium]